MKRDDKEKQVKVLQENFQNAKSTILVDYKGLNVAEITDLRKKLREASIEFTVVKNTLSKIAAKGTDAQQLEDFFRGPTATAISRTDPIAPVRVLNKFAKENPKLEFKAAIVEGTLFKSEHMSKLAELPSREELLSSFLGTLKAPLTSYVRLMSGLASGLLNVLNGIKDSKSA